MANIRHKVNLYRRYPAWYARRTIFIHIPKAAGTSINRALYGKTLGHYTADEIRRQFPKLYARCFVFAAVRNPWDRVLSAYRFAKQGRTESMGIRNPSQYEIPEFRSFESFLLEWLVTQDVSKIDFVFRPQMPFLCDSDGQQIVDFVARFESLPDDMQSVSSKVGYTVHLPHANRTAGAESYRQSYENDAMIDVVSRVYELDIERFNYEF